MPAGWLLAAMPAREGSRARRGLRIGRHAETYNHYYWAAARDARTNVAHACCGCFAPRGSAGGQAG